MRQLFLLLLLINLLALAWQFWVSPRPPAGPLAPGAPELRLFGAGGDAAGRSPAPGRPTGGLEPGLAPDGGSAVPRLGEGCLRVGPFPALEAAAELASSLTDRGIPATSLALDGQIWLGNWVQVGGFATAADAEAARQKLVAGGLQDALLLQDGSAPVISLGVFRERAGADRVMAVARQMGFRPVRTDRYRAGAEHWVVVRASADQPIALGPLGLPGAQILRAESWSCAALEPPRTGASDPGNGVETGAGGQPGADVIE